MNFLIVFALFFIGISGPAQEIEINLDDFSHVEISSGLKVEFNKANETNAFIIGKNGEKVILQVENGKLLIASGLPKLMDTDNILVKVNYAQIQNVEARENSNINFLDKISQSRIILSARTGAVITADLKVRDVLAKVSTGGKLELSGTAQYQEIEVLSAGDFRGENLKGETVKVILNGGGNAYISSNNYVNAFVRGGGNIYIYGNPKQVEEKTSYGGSIKKIN